MKKSNVALLVPLFALGACLPPAGDAAVDRNKDGIVDSGAGSVRSIDEVRLNVPTSPTVTIFGSFHDAYTGDPIADLAFVVSTSKGVFLRGASDTNGNFQVNDVSPGQFIIEADAAGHIPFRAVMTAPAPGGNTDNTGAHIGAINLLPTDGTWNFTLYTEDGRPVNNATIYVEYPSGLLDVRENENLGVVGAPQDIGVGVEPVGFRTFKATTNSSGVAQVPNMFKPNSLYVPFVGTARTMVQASVASQDFDADGTMDYGGGVTPWTMIAVLNSNGNFRLTPLTAIVNTQIAPVVTSAGAGSISGNVIIDGRNASMISRPLATNEPLVIIWNQPIDPALVDIVVINDWANKRNGSKLDNSTLVTLGQGFPIDKADYQTKPASGAPTLVVSVDPSSTIMTLTPTIPWQPGAEYVMTGQTTARARGTSTGALGASVTSIYQFGPKATGFRTASPDPLKISKVFLERNDGSDKYDNIVIQLSEVVRVYNDNTAVPPGPWYILVCADQDFSLIGRVQTASNGARSLVQGSCPPADYQIRGGDIGVGLVKARLRAGSAQTTNGSGRFFEIKPSLINSELVNSKTVKLRVYVNPTVDGEPWHDGAAGVGGTGDRFMSKLTGEAFQTGTVLSLDVNLGPPVTGAQLELQTDSPPQFE